MLSGNLQKGETAMKARKKKEKQRALNRKTKELVKTAPSFLMRDEENYFDYDMDHRDAEEAMRWVNTI